MRIRPSEGLRAQWSDDEQRLAVQARRKGFESVARWAEFRAAVLRRPVGCVEATDRAVFVWGDR